MKKLFRVALRVIAAVAAVFIITCTIIWGYITYNKEGIILKIKAAINKQVKGVVAIEGLSANFFYNFPDIDIRLSGVSIKDSLWNTHHHDFLDAQNIYIRLKWYSLFAGKAVISKVTVEKSLVYYYTDTSGYSNIERNGTSPAQSKSENIPDLVFKNVRVIYDYPGHNKLHDVQINKMECMLLPGDSGDLYKIHVDALVHNLQFNTLKGSYLKEKKLSASFNLLDTKKGEIKINNSELSIEGQPFLLTGFFSPLAKTFSLNVVTKKIDFKNAVSLLTSTAQQKFKGFNILKPVDINATLSGSFAYATIPLAAIHFTAADAAIETPAGSFSHCSFEGDFSNQITETKPRLDNNSEIVLTHLSAGWENILITAGKIKISNLLQPFLTCDLHSSFKLTALNGLAGSRTIRFIKGIGEMNISYAGSLTKSDTITTVMEGYMQVKDAAVNYIPRNIILDKLTGKFIFNNKDVIIEQLQAQAGSTQLHMDGVIKNLTGLIYVHPEKLVMQWNITTPYLNIDDFIAFLGKQQAGFINNQAAKTKLVQAANKIDTMLEYGMANVNIQAARLVYKKFNASGGSISLSLLPHKMILNSAKLDHAGGSMLLSGSFTDGDQMNTVNLQSAVTNADIPSLFKAFDNFGQDAITSQNMKGQLSAKVKFTALLSDKAVINTGSIKSTVNFSVLNGALIDFEPLQKISAAVFKKRDFSDVRFAELNNTLQINGSAVTFDKMEIRSNVFSMFVNGVYDTKKGTDMTIELPLSNLHKKEDSAAVIKTGRTGVKIRLRAKTGTDGKLNISWDPFNNGNKTREKGAAAIKKEG